MVNTQKGPVFIDCTVSNCRVGVSMPQDTPASFVRFTANECETAFELKEVPMLYEHLGLSKETPPEVLLAVLNNMQKNPPDSVGAVKDQLQNCDIYKYIGATANIATVIHALYQLVQGDFLGAAIQLLERSNS